MDPSDIHCSLFPAPAFDPVLYVDPMTPCLGLVSSLISISSSLWLIPLSYQGLDPITPWVCLFCSDSRTAPVGKSMCSARVISIPSTLVLIHLLLPDTHIYELFSTLLVARNFLTTERKLRFLCDFEKKFQFSRL